MKVFDFWVNLIANFLTCVASIIAIYLFLDNKNKISNVLNFILSYSTKVTLNELLYKIERLNDYNSSDENQKNEIINLLHDIEGQIIGNKFLNKNLENQLEKIINYIGKPKSLTEPKKRSLVSELRESIRSLDINNYGENYK